MMMEIIYGMRDPAQVEVYTDMVDECWRSMAQAVNPGPHFLLEIVPVCKDILLS
jgi:hypothetical protein